MNAGSMFREVTGDLRNRCFLHFCKQDGITMSFEDFCALTKELFVDAAGESYDVPLCDLETMFQSYDTNHDGKLDETEFKIMWTDMITKVLRPRVALLVIDVQNDFIDGSLALRNCPLGQEALDVVEPINKMLNYFKDVVYSYDWHPANHISFIDNISLYEIHKESPVQHPKVFDTVLFNASTSFVQTLWPVHCVQESEGAKLHSKLRVVDDAIIIYKGSNPDIDSYSAFWDNQKRSKTNLDNELTRRNVTDVIVCGLAYDFCVGYTAMDALNLGYRAMVVEDACRGVSAEGTGKMKTSILSNHGCFISSEDVQCIVSGRDRRYELAVSTAKFFAMKNN